MKKPSKKLSASSSFPFFRAGIGVDTHPLVEGRPLILGGVKIPFSKGLEGHSDGDCLTHAIVDAVLGAAGLGDIGAHFGASRPKYKNAASKIFLEGAVKKIRKVGWRVNNVDATVICEAPKLGPYFPKMKKGLSKLLGVNPSVVNLKATTAKGLGPVGASQAVSVFVAVTITK